MSFIVEPKVEIDAYRPEGRILSWPTFLEARVAPGLAPRTSFGIWRALTREEGSLMTP